MNTNGWKRSSVFLSGFYLANIRSNAMVFPLIDGIHEMSANICFQQMEKETETYLPESG